MGSECGIGWTANGWKDELFWFLCVKLAENMFLLIHCIVGSLRHLAWLSLASNLSLSSSLSLSSHSTPPSHRFSADCAPSSRCGCSFKLQFSTLVCNFMHVPCPKSLVQPGGRNVCVCFFEIYYFTFLLHIACTTPIELYY